MSGMLVQSEFTYRSGAYQFSVVSNVSGAISVRDIQDAYGIITSPYAEIPQFVMTDMTTAVSQVESILSLTSSVNGTVTFTSETEKSVLFPTAFANTSYRVYLSSDLFVPFRIINKTLTGFTIQAGSAITGDVGYDVLV